MMTRGILGQVGPTCQCHDRDVTCNRYTDDEVPEPLKKKKASKAFLYDEDVIPCASHPSCSIEAIACTRCTIHRSPII